MELSSAVHAREGKADVGAGLAGIGFRRPLASVRVRATPNVVTPTHLSLDSLNVIKIGVYYVDYVDIC